jgi:pyridoxamine 5'-phosphate oxidase
MALATIGADGIPNVRMVLLKGFDEHGFVFYTNVDSQKGQELGMRPQAGLVFYWKSLKRQVRIRGQVEPVTDAEADAYFATRPRLAQIGAWASKQSAPLESRLAFEKSVALQTAKFALGTVPRPPHWSGYRVIPTVIEFWHDRPYRLHDRVEFRRSAPGTAWSKTRLYP